MTITKANTVVAFAVALALSASVANPLLAQGKGKGAEDKPAPTQKKPAENYTIEQAASDKAQLMTISFNGLAFITGTYGADTFLPPGKVADYFGFQYMRDIDAAEAGHNMQYLTKIANNTLAILTPDQEKILVALASGQTKLYTALAEKRLVLIRAFRDNMEKKLPSALSREGVSAWVSDVFAIDGELSYGRAEAYGRIASGLTGAQKEALGKLSFGDSSTWPELPDQMDKRSMSHEQNVAVMTYASEFFSWYAGSPYADIYFCPERHGTYFGGFYMKDYPAMGNQDYFIPTALTGDSGESFLNALTPEQAGLITEIITLQANDLRRLIEIRTAISAELRKFLSGGRADKEAVMSLSKEYGEIDGRLSWLYATRFAAVAQSLSGAQKSTLAAIRNQSVFPDGAFLYADPIPLPSPTLPKSLGGK